jgi:hypothetical protein
MGAIWDYLRTIQQATNTTTNRIEKSRNSWLASCIYPCCAGLQQEPRSKKKSHGADRHCNISSKDINGCEAAISFADSGFLYLI